MGHWVNDVVDSDAVGQRCKALWIPGIVRPLPGISKVHVMADGDLHPTPLVEDSKPAWLHSVLLIGPSRPDILKTRNLNALAR